MTGGEMRLVRARSFAWARRVGLGLALTALVAPPAAAEHHLDLDAGLVREGTLTVGLSLTGKPFAYKRNGVLRGFEVAVARAVAAAHDLELRLVQLPRRGLARALRAGEVDAINTLALDAADPRPGGMQTIPYLRVGDHMMVLRGNPFRVGAYEDLSGRMVAATAGSTAEDFALEVNRTLAEAGRRPMRVHTLPQQRYTHVAVSIGHAAAYFLPTVSAVGISRDPHARTRLVEGAFRPRREVGFGVRAGNAEARRAIEHAVAAMVGTGKYARLLERHGLPQDLSAYRDAPIALEPER